MVPPTHKLARIPHIQSLAPNTGCYQSSDRGPHPSRPMTRASAIHCQLPRGLARATFELVCQSLTYGVPQLYEQLVDRPLFHR